MFVRIVIVTPAAEPPTSGLSKGQRRWWVRLPSGRFAEHADRVPMTDTGSFTIETQPGRHTIGCGEVTRLACVVSADTDTIEVFGDSGLAIAVTSAPDDGADTPLPAPERIEGAPVKGEPAPAPITIAPALDLDGWAWEGDDPPVSGWYCTAEGAARAGESAIGRGPLTRRVAAGHARLVRASSRDPRHTGRLPLSTDPVSGPPVPAATSIPAPVRLAVPVVRDSAPTAPPAPPRIETPPVKAGPSFTFTSEHGDGTAWVGKRDADSAARIEGDAAYLHATFPGLALPPPVVELGGVVNATGRANLARSHATWEAMPLATDALRGLIDAVRAERRRDLPVSAARDVRMLPDGRIALPDHGHDPIRLEHDGLRALVRDHASVLPRASEVMSLLPTSVRADVWNTQVPGSLNTNPRVIRTRETDAGRAAFAVVSGGYTTLDADQIGGLVLDALSAARSGGESARAELRYDPESTDLSIDLTWHAEGVSNFAAGDIFRIGARISGNDAGGGAIRASFLAYRNLCYNLLVIGTGTAHVARIVHRGSRSAMVDALVRGLAHVRAGAEPFLRRWGHVRERDVASLLVSASADPSVNALAVIRGLVKGGRTEDDALPTLIRNALPEGIEIDTAGIERDVLCEALLSGWRAEPGADLASIVNAVTRLHTERVPVPVLRSAETTAGALLTHWS